jgi:hypothetical protein
LRLLLLLFFEPFVRLGSNVLLLFDDVAVRRSLEELLSTSLAFGIVAAVVASSPFLIDTSFLGGCCCRRSGISIGD